MACDKVGCCIQNVGVDPDDVCRLVRQGANVDYEPLAQNLSMTGRELADPMFSPQCSWQFNLHQLADNDSSIQISNEVAVRLICIAL